MIICLLIKCRGRAFKAVAIAVSSAVYRFCSALAATVLDCVVGSWLVTILSVLWTATPMPTILFLLNELVAIHMPWVALVISVVTWFSASIIAEIHSSQRLIAKGLMVFILSVDVCQCISTIFCNDDENLWNIIVINCESGFDLSSIQILT